MCGVRPQFAQAFLRDGAASALSVEDELAQDRQREGVIVFTGSLAQFLPPGDEKVVTLAHPPARMSSNCTALLRSRAQ
jgi:hypothetical protein